MIYLLELLWIFVSVLMIGVILLQRGKGGGLVGALGGMGGSSAFGTKAGDMFTRITVGFFAAWILLAAVLIWTMRRGEAIRTVPAAAAADTKKGGEDADKNKLNEDLLKRDAEAKAKKGAEDKAKMPAPSTPDKDKPAEAGKDSKAAAEKDKSAPPKQAPILANPAAGGDKPKADDKK
jgi:preprotein translocase subunit SecG